MYSGGKDLAWRKRMIAEHTVLAVISFPNDLFYPQASVEPVVTVLKKGSPHTDTQKTVFVRITDDGFIKLKRRRLNHGRDSQMELLSQQIKSFIAGGTVSEVPGVIQEKAIDLGDPNLEIVPQQWLDNPVATSADIKRELSSLYSEFVFQEIRRSF